MEPIRPTDCFYYLISRATLVATSVLKRELAAAGVPRVKPAYLGVLMSLWNEDGLAAAELGRRAGLEPSTMTGLLDRMERDGLLTRRPDPRDRRAQRIDLSEDGKRCREPVLQVVERTLANASKGFSEQEIAGTKNLLRHFLINMQEERRGSDESENRRL
jgi:DNA-binding MarR family transcriptional regulator